jgi:cytidylate kinase
VIKIYALVTMGDQKWIREIRSNTSTRTNRKKQNFKKITDISITTCIIINIVILVSLFGK